MLLPLSDHIKQIHISAVGPRTQLVYLFVVALFSSALISLPLLHFDVSTKALGIVRPTRERTDLVPLSTGLIDTIFYQEGQLVPKNGIIFRIRNNNIGSKKRQNAVELAQRRTFIRDLQLLTNTPEIGATTLYKLQSALYRQQISRFLFRQAEQRALIRKAEKELATDSILAQDKVIAPKSLFEKAIEYEKLTAAFAASKQEQLSLWQQDLAQYQLEMAQLEAHQAQLQQEQKLYEIRAPITGTLQGTGTRYTGGLVQAGETIGMLSPEDSLVAECLVTPRDIGLLKLGQQVKFQVDAFNYNYFGILTGRLRSIDNDFTLVDGKPFFKVRCVFDDRQLLLKNGFTGNLKKGMTLQARFLVARRSLWQLLWDNLDDWLNPSVAPKT